MRGTARVVALHVMAVEKGEIRAITWSRCAVKSSLWGRELVGCAELYLYGMLIQLPAVGAWSLPRYHGTSDIARRARSSICLCTRPSQPRSHIYATEGVGRRHRAILLPLAVPYNRYPIPAVVCASAASHDQ